MSLEPFFNAPSVIQFHILAALVGLVTGPFALFRNRRDKTHKRLGYIWFTAMVSLSVSSLFIHSDMAIIGPFGPIHILSVFTLYGVTQGLWHIRSGNIKAHRVSMQSVWFGAMGLAGLFTFVPGRIMNDIVLGGSAMAGWLLISVGIVRLAVLYRRWNRLAVQ